MEIQTPTIKHSEVDHVSKLRDEFFATVGKFAPAFEPELVALARHMGITSHEKHGPTSLSVVVLENFVRFMNSVTAQVALERIWNVSTAADEPIHDSFSPVVEAEV